jgi:hypothetical protein
MPPVGFEPTTPVFDRAKNLHALNRAATVIDTNMATMLKYGAVTVELKTVGIYSNGNDARNYCSVNSVVITL